MSALTDELIARNGAYAREHEPRAPLPTLNTVILSCVDARIDPAHVLGIAPGEALVLRNAGGRVTEAVEHDIGLLIAMASKALGRAAEPELIVVHHTQCGVERLCNHEVAQALAGASKIPVAQLEARAIEDHDASLRRDVDRLAASPHVPSGLRVTAMRYDQESGHIEQRFSEVL